MKFLDRFARTAAGAGNVCKRAFLENAMRRLSTTLVEAVWAECSGTDVVGVR